MKEFNDVHARLSGWMKEAIDRICKKDGNDALEVAGSLVVLINNFGFFVSKHHELSLHKLIHQL